MDRKEAIALSSWTGFSIQQDSTAGTKVENKHTKTL
jgi:hypothetical protein